MPRIVYIHLLGLDLVLNLAEWVTNTVDKLEDRWLA